MQKLAIALAALAAMSFSATAFAGDATPQAPTAMSDSEMDNVTAGAPFFPCCPPGVTDNSVLQASRGPQSTLNVDVGSATSRRPTEARGSGGGAFFVP